MKILEALEPIGKARLPGSDDFAQEIDGELMWCRIAGDAMGILACVGWKDVARDDWQPCPEVKEIRPETAGELWERDGESNHRCVVYKNDIGLNVVWWGGDEIPYTNYVENDMIHNKNGWKRICPEVKEVWGKSAIQNDKYKAAQIYANKTAREAIELLADIKRQSLEIEKAVIRSADKPFTMDEMSARAAGIWKDGKIDLLLYAEYLNKKHNTSVRIEIDNVEWIEDDGIVYPRGGFKDWKSLPGRLPMKMVLFLEKEEHECQG